MRPPDKKPRIALWFRYGAAEHTDLFHAMPAIIEQLAQHAEVHYYGTASDRPVPERIARHAILHDLPFRIQRTNEKDKVRKTLWWCLCLPWIGLRCRWQGVRAVYIDETVPLTAPIARLFFGRNVAITVADFFVDIYAEKNPLIRRVGGLIKRIDMHAWRRLPLIFTRAKSTRAFLTEQGIPAERIHPVYDPCDLTIYHPGHRDAARAKYHYSNEEVVLVHHGILHPNKGNDRIIRALAEHRDRFPRLRYLLIGDGPDMPALRALTAELAMEQVVTFTGWLKTLAEVNEALNAGDIGLVMRIGQASDHFHMTGALVHSMACGLPVLAARLAGVSEAIEDGHNGFLFDPQTLQDFPDQLDRLYVDAALRRRLGEQALRDARAHFDMDRVVERTVQPLVELVRQ